MTRHAAAAGAALLLFALCAAAPAAAQPCAGLPLGGRTAATLGAGVSDHGFGAGGRTADVGAGVHAALPLGLAGSLEAALRRPRGAAVDIAVVRADLRRPVPRRGVDACVVTGLAAAHGRAAGSQTAYTNLSLPLGLAIGRRLAVGAVDVVPYAVPQLILSTVSGTVLDTPVDANGWSTALDAGVGLRAGRVLATLSALAAAFDPALGTPAHPNRGVVVRVGWVF